ncbi:hypothetical protein ColLi_12984 [Colletotrichum liriopes]|uniref:Uncharacterized protein n=1 Tax=Colletotrichum liriopes TaxID=708192 RepID=A0AA37M025_9PEZI|nr:hypothetical protein ColLi_12984 [Colletotrichum liriopes]
MDDQFYKSLGIEPLNETDKRREREPQSRNDTAPFSRPILKSLLFRAWKVCRYICIYAWNWGLWVLLGTVVLVLLTLIAWVFQKLDPIISFTLGSASWVLRVGSAATAQTFAALPAWPYFFSSTPSSVPNTNNAATTTGIHSMNNSKQVLWAPPELGLVLSGTGLSLEVATNHATFLIDTLSDDLFVQEKPVLNFEVQKISSSWNSAHIKWATVKRTWEMQVMGFFFNISWESEQLAALVDMWDKADKQAQDRPGNSMWTVDTVLLKLRQLFPRGVETARTRQQSTKVAQIVRQIREILEGQLKVVGVVHNDLQDLHNNMGTSRSIACGAGKFLRSRQKEETGSADRASDSMYVFCKTLETGIVEMDLLMSKASEDTILLQRVHSTISSGLDSLVRCMAIKEDSLLRDGDEDAESEKLVRNGVVKIVLDAKDQITRHFTAQYNQ